MYDTWCILFVCPSDHACWEGDAPSGKFFFVVVGVFSDVFATRHERCQFMHNVILVQILTKDDASSFEEAKFFHVDKFVHSDEYMRNIKSL